MPLNSIHLIAKLLFTIRVSKPILVGPQETKDALVDVMLAILNVGVE